MSERFAKGSSSNKWSSGGEPCGGVSVDVDGLGIGRGGVGGSDEGERNEEAVR